MNLISPWMLAFLVSLPAIIALYLLKRTYEKQTVPSILLWQKLLREMEANRPWQKLRRNLLLLLQLLAAALLAFSLARPTIPGNTPLAEHTIAVLDVSASMAAAQEGETRLEQSKKELSELIGGLSPQQRLTLISMGREARVLAAGNDPAELNKALDNAAQEYGAADYEGALSLAAALSGQDAQSAVRLYTDGHWGLDPKLLPIFGSAPTLVAGEGGTQNVGIRHAAAVILGTSSALVATVENYGDKDTTFDVQVLDEKGELLESNQLTLPPNGQQALSWNNLPQLDVFRVLLTGLSEGQDSLAADNERTVLPEQSGSSKIWLATQGNLFLEKALSLGGHTVERGSDPNAPPKDAALYVYDGFLPTQWPEGAVLLVNPPQGEGILSAGAALEPGKLQVEVPDANVLRYVDLSKLHLQAVRDITPVPWLQPIVTSGGTPLLLTGEQEGHRVGVLAFDLHKSDLPLLPAFPLLIQNLKEDLLPAAAATLGETEAGHRVALLPPIRETGWHYTDPSGERHTVEQAMVEHGFEPTLPGLYRFQDESGNQQMLLAVHTPAAESKTSPVKIAVPTSGGGGEEGNGDETGGGGDADANGNGDNANANTASTEGQREIWRYLAMLILLLCFLEWGVYKRGY